MQNSKVLAGLVNDRLAEHRASMKPASVQPPAQPIIPAQSVGTDSLSDLARLKASGDITVEEYERMKARIIGS
jgi:hypothetical protein